MTKRDILSVALKILGVISIMRVIESVFVIGMGFATMFGKPEVIPDVYNPDLFMWTGIISFVLWITMAYLLLRWGDLFAEKLIRDDSIITILDNNLWERPVFILSLRIIGVVCLAMGIPRLIDFLFDLGVSVMGHRQQSTVHVTSIAFVFPTRGIYHLCIYRDNIRHVSRPQGCLHGPNPGIKV